MSCRQALPPHHCASPLDSSQKTYHSALRTNSNLLASFQRPPFPEQRCNAYCTSPAQANLNFTSANASTCRSRAFGRAYSRIFPALLFDSHYQRNAQSTPPPSHGSILVSRTVADDKKQASQRPPKTCTTSPPDQCPNVHSASIRYHEKQICRKRARATPYSLPGYVTVPNKASQEKLV